LPSSEMCERYLEDRFGEEEILEEYRFEERSGDFWVIPEEMELDEEYITAGIRAFRDTGIGIKPTTYFLQFLGERIERNVVDLDREELEKLVFERQSIDCELTPGYVALRFRGEIIGCGLNRTDGLETQIPKGRAKTLRHDLEDE